MSISPDSQALHKESSSPPRAHRRPHRRAQTLRGALLLTLLSGLIPGYGFVYNGRRVLGCIVLALAATFAGALVWLFPHNRKSALDLAFDPNGLKTAAAVIAIALVGWVIVVIATYVVVRPIGVTRWKTGIGAGFVGLLCIAVAAPVTVAARYAMVQADLVSTVFSDDQSATTPHDVTETDPWGGRERVNVLLLGGDGGEGRIGVRTDSMILASVNTRTGRAVTFSLPRNMMYAKFPRHTPLHKIYPNGFTGSGDEGNWMLNAVYREVPLLHPGILGKTDNEGADALKLAVQGSTGLRVDYYVLVSIKGFRDLVDAMGGVTVNINTQVAIGGNTDKGKPPSGYLHPGPNQHLDGYDALWFARGRYGADDYQRMDRQRCMVEAIINQANPLNLLRRFQALAEVGKKLVYTDIPRKLMPAFVELALKVKEYPVRSVVFRESDQFYPGDPDYSWLRARVHQALQHHHHQVHSNHTGSGSAGKDPCAYHPTP
jgi:LCP family protein required for cell wall assembly